MPELKEANESLLEVESNTTTMKGRYGFSTDKMWTHKEVYPAAIEKADRLFDSYGIEEFGMEWVTSGEDSGYLWKLKLTVERN